MPLLRAGSEESPHRAAPKRFTLWSRAPGRGLGQPMFVGLCYPDRTVVYARGQGGACGLFSSPRLALATLGRCWSLELVWADDEAPAGDGDRSGA